MIVVTGKLAEIAKNARSQLETCRNPDNNVKTQKRKETEERHAKIEKIWTRLDRHLITCREAVDQIASIINKSEIEDIFAPHPDNVSDDVQTSNSNEDGEKLGTDRNDEEAKEEEEEDHEFYYDKEDED